MSKVDKDMGSTEADQRLNSQIRQALNADTSLAGVGRNVYFNTKNGEVTLQGSVSSEAEKNQIEQKVKQMSNVGNVKNELQVANMGSSSAMGGSSKSSTSTGTTSSSSTGTTNR
jgi:osmotically-inducible protein OsmY